MLSSGRNGDTTRNSVEKRLKNTTAENLSITMCAAKTAGVTLSMKPMSIMQFNTSLTY